MPSNDLFSVEMVKTANVGDLAALQKELTRLQHEVSSKGGLKDDVTLAVGMLHRYATGIVHVDTGRLKNSLFWNVTGQGNSIIGYMATNVAYSIHENRRGGQHAFMERTYREEGPHVNDIFRVMVIGR